MMLKCRELTRMIASDELPEARWPVRMGGWLHLLRVGARITTKSLS